MSPRSHPLTNRGIVCKLSMQSEGHLRVVKAGGEYLLQARLRLDIRNGYIGRLLR